MSLYQEFKTKKKGELKTILKKKNIFEVPQIDKVIVAIGIGSLATRKGIKDFSDLEKNLMTITGQKPKLIKSKKSISNFKLREGMPVMLQVTLRRARAFDFLEKLNKLALPRVRDFQGLVSKKFDGKGNINMGFDNQVVFPEINPEQMPLAMGIQVTITTTAKTDEEAKELLKVLGFIIKK